MDLTRIKAGGIEVRLDGGGEGFRSSLSTSTLRSGVEIVHLRIESGDVARPPVFRRSWSHPLVSVHDFWREHRDVLLDGALEPLHPEAIYPIVLACTVSKLAAAAYGNAVVPLEGEIPPTLLVVNGTLDEGVVLNVADDAGTRQIEVRDCRGRVTHTDSIGLETGLHHIDIPPAGVAVLK
jgi:hypothetical protein